MYWCCFMWSEMTEAMEFFLICKRSTEQDETMNLNENSRRRGCRQASAGSLNIHKNATVFNRLSQPRESQVQSRLWQEPWWREKGSSAGWGEMEETGRVIRVIWGNEGKKLRWNVLTQKKKQMWHRYLNRGVKKQANDITFSLCTFSFVSHLSILLVLTHIHRRGNLCCNLNCSSIQTWWKRLSDCWFSFFLFGLSWAEKVKSGFFLKITHILQVIWEHKE